MQQHDKKRLDSIFLPKQCHALATLRGSTSSTLEITLIHLW